jgi:hypothetical protein
VWNFVEPDNSYDNKPNEPKGGDDDSGGSPNQRNPQRHVHRRVRRGTESDYLAHRQEEFRGQRLLRRAKEDQRQQ